MENRIVDVADSEEEGDDEYVPLDSSGEESSDNISNDDELVNEDDIWLPHVDDGYDPYKSNEWKVDKDVYFDRLYANGEFYTDNQFGNTVLRKWMIFFDKEHLSRVLREYCIQEGFCTMTLKSDMRRLTATCASTICDWRIHASKLSDGYRYENLPINGITPKVAKRLRFIVRQSRGIKVFKASSTECEVKDGFSYLLVNIADHTCACGVWQITGIPCKHAVRAIMHMRTGASLEEYVSRWYSTEAYKTAYSVNFHPVPDEEQWPVFDLPKISPPIMKRGIGRPSRNRRREEGEKPKGKRSGTVRCGKCKAYGHNAKTCKGGLTARECKEQGLHVEQRQRQKRKRKVQPPNSQFEDPLLDSVPDVMGSAPWKNP